MKGTSRGLARRYAHALLDVAEEQKADAGALRTELHQAGALLLGEPELSRILQHPAVSTEKKKQVLAALWETARPSTLLRKLVDLLVGRDRLALLPGIEAAYSELWNERRGVVAVEAVTAVELSAAQREALAGALEKKTGQTVELDSRVEPAVLGGLLVRMGGKTYDGTVRGRLAALRESLVQGR